MAGETGLYGMVVPTTAPKPAEKNPLRPKYNGMGRNDMMGSATNNEEHMAITIVPVEGEAAAAPAPTAAPAVETSAPVTETEVLAAQKLWAESIASISKVFADGGDFVGAAGEAAGKLYGYGKSNVLFKPTKATNNPFRPDADSAMSYFVGSKAMNNPKFDGEDGGFAINGGKGFSKSVIFTNHQIERSAARRLLWATTSSSTRPAVTRSASSTPSATSATTTARSASSCTTRRSRTRPKSVDGDKERVRTVVSFFAAISVASYSATSM